MNPLEPIQCDIMLIDIEIDRFINENPTLSIKNMYDQKEIDLTVKYGSFLVAKYWPEYESRDSALFKKKTKLKFPTNI